MRKNKRKKESTVWKNLSDAKNGRHKRYRRIDKKIVRVNSTIRRENATGRIHETKT